MKRYAIMGKSGTSFAVINTYATAERAAAVAKRLGLTGYRIVTVTF